MAVNSDLHNIIYFHRKQAKLNRKDLADLAGVGKTVIYDIEHGKETVKWATIKVVLEALNIKITFNSPLMANNEKTQGENT
ncbi:MAG: helix-turn-helix domain-containing protein [Cyclobacteriaceae bacterium]